MAWRLIFIISAVAIAAAVMARYWYGKRVLASHGGRPCRPNPARWQEVFGLPAEAGDKAASHGKALRLAALALWQRRDARAAGSREASLRFGLGVPPLTMVVVVFAVAVAKLPLFGGLAVILGTTALAALFSLLSIGPELRAVMAAARLAHERHLFPRAADEEAAFACARAQVWMEALPPILRWI